MHLLLSFNYIVSRIYYIYIISCKLRNNKNGHQPEAKCIYCLGFHRSRRLEGEVKPNTSYSASYTIHTII